MNIAQLARDAARKHPDGVAVIDGGTTTTFRELWRMAVRIALDLQRRGLSVGDRVIIAFPNGLPHIAAKLGVLAAGMVVVPLNLRWDPDTISYVLEETEAAFVFGSSPGLEELAGKGAALPPRLSERDLLTVLDACRAENGDAAAEYECSPVSGDDLATIMYTAGTSGQPKGVLQHHGLHWIMAAPNWIMATRAESNDNEREDPQPAGSSPSAMGCVSPMFHVGGSGAIFASLAAGAPLVTLGKWDPGAFVDVARRTGISSLHMVGTVLLDLLRHVREAGLPQPALPDLKVVHCGGSTITQEDIADFERLVGGVVVEGYGKTEGSGTFSVPGDPLGKGNNGKVDPDNLRIEPIEDGADDSTSVQAGKSDAPVVGEILLFGPRLARGYWRRPDLTAELYRADGWMRTGDLGFIDHNGYLHFVGRRDDMLKSGGENVYPDEIEHVIQAASANVGQVVVFGIPDKRWGQKICAVLAADLPDVAGLEDLANACRTKLAKFAMPRLWLVVDSLPLLGSNKVDKRAVREIAAAPGSPQVRLIHDLDAGSDPATGQNT